MGRAARGWILLGTLAAAASPAAAWERIAAGGDTGCGPGSPYSFFVERGDPKRLLVFLQGGGACWSALLCNVNHGEPTYDPIVDASDVASASQGILDLANPANPFHGATALFLPYCTGNVHLGSRAHTYRWPAEDGSLTQFEVQHFGYRNAMAGLRWVFEQFPKIDGAFVAGHSAGGAASPFYAAVVAERYPAARVVQLADGSGAFRAGAVPDLMELWGAADVVRARPGYRTGETIDFEELYAATSRAFPRVRLAQLNRRDDAAQAAFVGLAGRSLPTRSLLAEGQAAIRRAVPGLRTYTAEGSVHATLATNEFYVLETAGTRLRDWVAALAEGTAVEDVAPPSEPAR